MLVTELSALAADVVFNVGKAWIPRAAGIGPYSGKETFLLVGWAASWIGLHLALRRRDVDVKIAFGVAMGMVLVGIALVWPPVWHLFG